MNTLSLSEAAARFGISQPTLSNYVKAGLLTPARRGGPGQPTLVLEVDVARLAEHFIPGRTGRGNMQRMAQALAGGSAD